MDQVFVLLMRQGPFVEEVRARSKTDPADDSGHGVQRVSGDEFINYWGAN